MRVVHLAATALDHPTGLGHARGVPFLLSDVRRMAIARVEMSPGTDVEWLGGRGSGQLEWNYPAGLAARPAGGFLVADRNNSRITAASDDFGSDWEAFGSHGSGEGEFDSPTAVAIDADGRILVADTGNCRVVRVDDMSGNGWVEFGRRGEPTQFDPLGVKLFREPVAVAVEPDGTIVVVDRGLMRVVRMSPDPQADDWSTTGVVDPPGWSAGVAAASPGRVAVAELTHRRVTIRGGLDQPSIATTQPGALAGPGPLVAHPDGGHVVLDVVSRRLVALTTDGSDVRVDGERRLGPLGIDRPVGMCVT